MKLTPDELKTRRGEISTLERIGALREACFPRIFEFATSICSDAVWQEHRAVEAPMDQRCVAAPFGYRRDGGVLFDLIGGGVAFALFAEGDKEARQRRRQCLAEHQTRGSQDGSARATR
jgi:hypothetical protein